ncbi:MAG: hypothetical protein IJZ44_09010 [Lachnospiraceae bacterium]|nr:hypothetical protein [Lachnospiraceae bacterium]
MSCSRKTRKAISILVAVLSFVIFIFAYRYTHPTHWRYNDHWILGKTAPEVIERYGPFDLLESPLTAKGEYLNIKVSYLIEPERVGYLGTYPAEYYSIHFDWRGIADNCFIELGGVGG